MTPARVAEAFLKALEQRDVAAIESLLAEDVCQILPLAAVGGIDPAATFSGRSAVIEVQQAIVDSFDPISFLDTTTLVGEDGATVVVETLGERLHRDTGKAYRNRYLYRFEVTDGLVVRIVEYSNPVTFARFFDQPVG